MIYLHENGVTIVATKEAKRGKVYELNGEEYYVARGVADIKRIVESGEYPLNRVVTSKLTSFNYLFQINAGWGQRAVPENFNDDISCWDTSNVLSMEEVFTGWPDFNQDISNWDTSRVESMHGMFKSSKYKGNYFMGPTSFNQDISKWDVSNVKNMSEMFLGATSFNQDISNWDVRNVENMDYMFSGAISFNQPIGNWDVYNVKTMKGMFSDVTSIGIVAFVGTLEYNRAGFTSFNQDIGNWDVSNVKNMSEMFSGATSFNQDISSWDVSNVESMQWMFSGGIRDAVVQTIANNPTSFNQDIGNWDVSNVNNMQGMFCGATAFDRDISNWDVSNVNNMQGMFCDAPSFNQDISSWDVTSVGSMEDMFSGAISFNHPIGNWNVCNVSSMRHMFFNAMAFDQDISNWDVSSVSFVEGMFYGATSFNSAIGKWKFRPLKSIENMFREATAFNQDISNWDVSGITQMKGLFQDASSFNQDLRSWKLNEKLPKSRNIFSGATSFNIKQYSPFINVIAKERSTDNSTENLSKDDKKIYSKIKKLLVARDTDQIDIGIELLKSLNNINLYESLLDGCKLHSELVTNKLFTGSGPAQPYLNYALISIIANIPENVDVDIDDSIKIKNIKELNLSLISFVYDYSRCKYPQISNLKYLEKLTFEKSLPENTHIDGLKELICKDISGSLKWLTSFKQLEKLSMSFSSYGDPIEHLDSFKNLVSLKEFEFQPGGKFTDINFLSECKKLKKLNFAMSYGYGSENITDISILSRLSCLEYLEIKNIKDQDISSIGKCKKLENLKLSLSSEYSGWDFSFLNSCSELTHLVINDDGNEPIQINTQIESINGIKLPKNLYSLKLGKGIAFNGIDNGNLSDRHSKPKSIENNGIIRANSSEIVDKDIVSFYEGKPFSGIMYYCYQQGWNRQNYDDSQPVESEYEMLEGLKHGKNIHYYTGKQLAGKVRVEYNFVDDEYEKIIGFYDKEGNNYVSDNLCICASELNPASSSNIPEKDLMFYHNNNIFSGQVLVNKHISNWRPENDLNSCLYEIINSDISSHIPGARIDNDDLLFLIKIKEGRITGKFCVSSNDKFFSGTIDEDAALTPLNSMTIRNSSNPNSNQLSIIDKSIVITGVFENYSRNELKDLILENGGKPSSSVTSNTFLIVSGSKMGEKKKILADELGIKIINVDLFIKNYIDKEADNNVESGTKFIDIFYPNLATKKTVSKKNLKSEDKKTFTKIKSLLLARDFDKIDMGIELLRSINVNEFYEALLTDCKIHTAGGQSVVKNKLFTGSGPAQPYLNYALYLLIYFCPDDAVVDETLRKENIKFLNANLLFKNNYEHKYRLPLINNFTSLNELEISMSAFDINYTKPNDVLVNSSVEKITISESNGSISWLKNCPQIKSLLVHSNGYSNNISDFDVFNNLINLEELKINCALEENIDFLKKCVQLKKLTLNLEAGYGSKAKTKNIDALEYLKKLEVLEISGDSDENDFSFSGLSHCKNLKKIKLFMSASNEALSSLKNCSSLKEVYISSIDDCKIKLNMLDFSGLNKLDKLQTISLNGVDLLQSNSKLFIN